MTQSNLDFMLIAYLLLSCFWLVAVDLIVVCGQWLCPRALVVCRWGIIHVHLREVLVVVLIAHCGLSMIVGVCVGGGCSHGVVFMWVVGHSCGWWVFIWWASMWLVSIHMGGRLLPPMGTHCPWVGHHCAG